MSSTDHEIVLAGPAETGKTFAALWHLDHLLSTYPRSQAVLVRKVRATIYGSAMQTYQKVIALSRSGATAYGGAHPEWYDYPNGARLWIAGMDNPGKALSSERDFIYENQAEELDLGDHETLTTRATGRAGNAPYPQVIGDCNPGPPNHWIINRAPLKVLYSRHEDNPLLFDGGGQLTEQGTRTLRILDNLTGVRYKRLRMGQWVAAEGTVYDFDRSVHLIDPFPIPADWMRIRSIDFGYTNPFVCQWWALDGDGRMYLYREIYMTGRTAKAHAEQIKRIERWQNEDGSDNPDRERIAFSLADHDAEDRATLAENHIGTIAANKAVSPGIQAVQERMKLAGDGKPRLYIMRGALVERDDTLEMNHRPVCTEQEFDSYVWPKSADGRSLKEAPIKEHDHGLDSLRYAVMRFSGGHSNSAVGAFI